MELGPTSHVNHILCCPMVGNNTGGTSIAALSYLCINTIPNDNNNIIVIDIILLAINQWILVSGIMILDVICCIGCGLSDCAIDD